MHVGYTSPNKKGKRKPVWASWNATTRAGKQIERIQFFFKELGDRPYPEYQGLLDSATLPEGIPTSRKDWIGCAKHAYLKVWPIEPLSEELKKTRRQWRPESEASSDSEVDIRFTFSGRPRNSPQDDSKSAFIKAQGEIMMELSQETRSESASNGHRETLSQDEDGVGPASMDTQSENFVGTYHETCSEAVPDNASQTVGNTEEPITETESLKEDEDLDSRQLRTWEKFYAFENPCSDATLRRVGRLIATHDNIITAPPVDILQKLRELGKERCKDDPKEVLKIKSDYRKFRVQDQKAERAKQDEYSGEGRSLADMLICARLVVRRYQNVPEALRARRHSEEASARMAKKFRVEESEMAE